MEKIRQECMKKDVGNFVIEFNMLIKIFMIAFFTLLSFSVLGCFKQAKSESSAAEQEEIIVFAAASLTNVAQDLAEQFSKKENISVLVNTASSSTLARQIEQGSSADIYFSANKKWADYLLNLGLLDAENVVVIAQNSLALIVPSNNDSINREEIIKNKLPPGFLSSGRIAVGDPDHVPAGIYAKEALLSIGVYESVKERFIPCSSVREALLLVEQKETDWGIVYKTDAISSGKVNLKGVFSGDLHSPVSYYMGIIKREGYRNAQNLFYNFCLSEEGQSVFDKYGFVSMNSINLSEESE